MWFNAEMAVNYCAAAVNGRTDMLRFCCSWERHLCSSQKLAHQVDQTVECAASLSGAALQRPLLVLRLKDTITYLTPK